MRGEFELIARYLAPLTGDAPGAYRLAEDAATLAPPADEHLVLAVDTLVEGVHYLPADPAEQVAQKLIRVNLSDLAAMGAWPLGYLLSLALPASREEAWLAAFARGLGEDQAVFGLVLLGGDTVATPGPPTLTLTVLGHARPERLLRRSTASAGDLIYVSGTLGDAALGLKALRGELPGLAARDREALARRYRLPLPRLDLGRALAERALASAAIDVSDGLLADLGHVAEASGLGAEVRAAAVPLSTSAEAALARDPELVRAVLAGGDDYELLFTVAPQRTADVDALARRLGLRLTPVGHMTESGGVRALDAEGSPLALDGGGWTHF